jgi:hypothetical protein
MRLTRKRIAVASAIFLAVIFGGGLLLTTALPGIVAMFLYAGVYQSLFPSSVTWDSHGAYVKCAGAIADASQWPALPAKACQAMHLCANEATLSEAQNRALAAQIRATPGCQQP